MGSLVNYVLLLLPFLCVLSNEVCALNILGVFPYEGKSHFFVFQPFLEELAKRGHNLTVISYFPRNDPLHNYNDISLAGKSNILEDVFPLESSYYITTIIITSLFLASSGTNNCKILLADEKVQQLWKDEIKFDVVLVEQFNSDCSLGLAHKLGAPVVGLTSHTFMPWHYAHLGMSFNPSYTSFQFSHGGTKPTLYQRVESLIFHTYIKLLFKYYGQRTDQNTLAHYIGDTPPLEELAYKMNIFLVYTNPLLNGNYLLPPKVKEVGGYHVAKPKKLPTDILKFIEESTHGVIYVSFGTMVHASMSPKPLLEAMIAVLSELPQRVIWKWEEPTLPGNPKDMLVSSWLPQNDILAHPKVMAFYSHCGLLGTIEAMYHAVPMVGMPVFGDQPSNAAAIVESGLGVTIYIEDLTKDLLLQTFQTVLNPKFRANVKEISRAWHDRPMSPMDTAIFWTEYTARNSNFSLASPSVDVPLYQLLCLDVICIIVCVLLTSIFIIILLTKFLLKQFQRKIKNE